MMDIFHIGSTFESFSDFEKCLKEFQIKNEVNLWKSSSRTIEAGKKKAPNKNFKDSLF